MACVIHQGDLPLILAKVVQNEQVCDKETEGTDKLGQLWKTLL